MPTIRVDDEVWEYLKSKATPLEDTPNDVLRRELHIEHSPKTTASVDQGQSSVRVSLKPDKDYSYFPIKGYSLNGKFVACRSFAEMLVNLTSYLWRQDKDAFEKIALKLCGKKRPYFSKNRADLRKPQRVANSDFFVETNLSANSVFAISVVLLGKLGHDLNSFIVERV